MHVYMTQISLFFSLPIRRAQQWPLLTPFPLPLISAPHIHQSHCPPLPNPPPPLSPPSPRPPSQKPQSDNRQTSHHTHHHTQKRNRANMTPQSPRPHLPPLLPERTDIRIVYRGQDMDPRCIRYTRRRLPYDYHWFSCTLLVYRPIGQSKLEKEGQTMNKRGPILTVGHQLQGASLTLRQSQHSFSGQHLCNRCSYVSLPSQTSHSACAIFFCRHLTRWDHASLKIPWESGRYSSGDFDT